jgi:hypothetical protein
MVVLEDKLPLSVTRSRFENTTEPTVVVKLLPMIALSLAPLPLMETEPAVKFMIEKIEQRKERITFPWQMALPLQIIGVLPSSLSSFILSWLPQKGMKKL